MVFGIAGLAATFQGGPQRNSSSDPVRYESFSPPASATDRQIADLAFDRFRFPFADPIPNWALHRDAAGNLPLELWTGDGEGLQLYKPQEIRLRIQWVAQRRSVLLS